MNPSMIPQSALARFLWTDTRLSLLWLVVRVYIGYQWLIGGWEKLGNPAWVGPEAGTAVRGFLSGALEKTGGAHPDVTAWYAWFVENCALPNATVFSYAVTFGEIVVGVALILGLFTGFAAFLGMFLNFNFLLAGTVSVNPVFILIQLPLLLAWRSAGWYGVDRYALPIVQGLIRWKS